MVEPLFLDSLLRKLEDLPFPGQHFSGNKRIINAFRGIVIYTEYFIYYYKKIHRKTHIAYSLEASFRLKDITLTKSRIELVLYEDNELYVYITPDDDDDDDNAPTLFFLGRNLKVKFTKHNRLIKSSIDYFYPGIKCGSIFLTPTLTCLHSNDLVHLVEETPNLFTVPFHKEDNTLLKRLDPYLCYWAESHIAKVFCDNRWYGLEEINSEWGLFLKSVQIMEPPLYVDEHTYIGYGLDCLTLYDAKKKSVKSIHIDSFIACAKMIDNDMFLIVGDDYKVYTFHLSTSTVRLILNSYQLTILPSQIDVTRHHIFLHNKKSGLVIIEKDTLQMSYLNGKVSTIRSDINLFSAISHIEWSSRSFNFITAYTDGYNSTFRSNKANFEVTPLLKKEDLVYIQEPSVFKGFLTDTLYVLQTKNSKCYLSNCFAKSIDWGDDFIVAVKGFAVFKTHVDSIIIDENGILCQSRVFNFESNDSPLIYDYFEDGIVYLAPFTAQLKLIGVTDDVLSFDLGLTFKPTTLRVIDRTPENVSFIIFGKSNVVSYNVSGTSTGSLKLEKVHDLKSQEDFIIEDAHCCGSVYSKTFLLYSCDGVYWETDGKDRAKYYFLDSSCWNKVVRFGGRHWLQFSNVCDDIIFVASLDSNDTNIVYSHWEPRGEINDAYGGKSGTVVLSTTKNVYKITQSEAGHLTSVPVRGEIKGHAASYSPLFHSDRCLYSIDPVNLDIFSVLEINGISKVSVLHWHSLVLILAHDIQNGQSRLLLFKSGQPEIVPSYELIDTVEVKFMADVVITKDYAFYPGTRIDYSISGLNMVHDSNPMFATSSEDHIKWGNGCEAVLCNGKLTISGRLSNKVIPNVEKAFNGPAGNLIMVTLEPSMKLVQLTDGDTTTEILKLSYDSKLKWFDLKVFDISWGELVVKFDTRVLIEHNSGLWLLKLVHKTKT